MGNGTDRVPKARVTTLSNTAAARRTGEGRNSFQLRDAVVGRLWENSGGEEGYAKTRREE